jgi:hypothetical protein
MVPRYEHIRHAYAVKLDRACVLWPLEEAVKERVLLNGVVITEDAWEQPPDDIEEHHGWEFPPREDIITNRNLGVCIRLYPRIHTAVAPTDEE